MTNQIALETAPAYVEKAEYDKALANIDSLKTELEHSRNANVTLNNRIDSFKEEIKQFVVDNLGGRVDDDDLRQLAETFDIELTQEFAFELTVRFSGCGTIEGKFDEDKLRELLEGAFSCAETSFDDSGFEEIRVEEEGFTIDSIDVY